LNAGTGISLSGSNGNVTVSTTVTGGTVTSVGVSSSTLTVTNSPVTTTGTISVELPSAISLTGNVDAGNIHANSGVITSGSFSTPGNVSAGNIVTTGNIVSSGSITANNTGGIGYATGAGGAVTQGTSRTTGVTINKLSGAITLISAAGSATYNTFTVTNNTVAATDVIIVNQKSGTDKYEAYVTNVAAGSFQITFADQTGTTTEQPVFNFAVIKAVAA
jgi:hypothetical protein